MTLTAIKSMFAVGQKWQAIRESQASVIHGNLATTPVPANRKEETRTVEAVKSAEVVFLTEDGKHLHTAFPKASEVIEARPGFLELAYAGMGVTVTLVLLP